MNRRIIVIDGKTYNSVEEMPEEVRKRYEQAMGSLKDQNRDGVPDVLEGKNMLANNNRNGVPDLIENTAGGKIVANTIKVLVDGQEFNNLDELPPDARAKYEKAMDILDADGNGMPDFLEGNVRVQADPRSVVSSIGTPSSSIPKSPTPVESPTFTPDTTNGWMLGLLAAGILFVCLLVVAGGWYYFIR